MLPCDSFPSKSLNNLFFLSAVSLRTQPMDIGKRQEKNEG